ncbi:chloride channel protein [Halothermothrix orenii]|uniref:chloride channel protein n=1 Tax=Halothermothrix orenii TaxID=31909 RepID=UPI0002E1D564|nr:chloride channel protein [Halothermothrix orenii]
MILPAIGGFITSIIIYTGSKAAKGHGIPAILETIESNKYGLSSRDLLVEGLASAITIGSGGSAGRIGPVVEIGAGLGDIAGRKLNMPLGTYQTLLGCGAAAGIAAIFNAPLGGIMFAVEVLYTNLEIKRLSLIVISAISADAIVRNISGYNPIFDLPPFQLNHPLEYIFYIILGILLGIFSNLFIKGLYMVTNLFNNLKINYHLKPIIGGLFVGLTGFFIPRVLGTGIPVISKAFTKSYLFNTLIILAILKIVATCLTLGSGGSGGIFAPGLLVGASTGLFCGGFLNTYLPGIVTSPESYGIVGMAAFISGIIRAPLTAVLIIFELTGNYSLILPLLLGAVLASNISKHICPESIYSPKLFYREISNYQNKVKS